MGRYGPVMPWVVIAGELVWVVYCGVGVGSVSWSFCGGGLEEPTNPRGQGVFSEPLLMTQSLPGRADGAGAGVWADPAAPSPLPLPLPLPLPRRRPDQHDTSILGRRAKRRRPAGRRRPVGAATTGVSCGQTTDPARSVACRLCPSVCVGAGRIGCAPRIEEAAVDRQCEDGRFDRRLLDIFLWS